jgi:hypothetical protein
MARSHHRKKHKAHLRKFKHSHDVSSSKATGKAAGVFTFGGIVVGLATGFFASNANILWVIVGAALGAIAGFFLGKKLDSDRKG